MGPSHPRNSSRATKARSSESPSKLRHKPVSSERSDVATEVIRDAERRFRVKSRPSPEAMAARLEKRKPNTGLGTAVVDALREVRDDVPAPALREIRRKLDIASAVAYVCAAALRGQAADNGIDVALCLQRCVGDALFDQMQHIDRLLGEPEGEEEDEDGGAE